MMTVPRSQKITPTHLQRKAVVYIRQSTTKQVRLNPESQHNQRALAERAELLGWPKERIVTLDADLGHSGASTEGRDDFTTLTADVALGHVGIIFGWEVSRLARNNADWYHLLDLACVVGTLIADIEGIYDPRSYNDRLLLGLKGTMSEAELHMMRQRLNAGRLSKVARGDYIQHLPTGLIRTPDGRVEFDPDDQVRAAIALVFTTFAELGSGMKTLRYLTAHHILLPRHQTSGLLKGELLWKEPTESTLIEILRNPAYAGVKIYSYPGNPGLRYASQAHRHELLHKPCLSRHSGSGRYSSCLNVYQMETQPMRVAYLAQMPLLGRRPDLLPRIASQSHLSRYRCDPLEALANCAGDQPGSNL